MLEDGQQCFCREDPTGPWDHLSPQGPKTFIYLPGNKDFCQNSPSFVSLESQNCRLGLMPVFTTILVNYGLYL